MRDPRIIPLANQIRRESGSKDEFIFNTLKFVTTNIEYVEDMDNQGQNEYVQMPYETLELGKGDCEDMAILNVALLWAGGVNESRETFGYVHTSHRWVEVNTSKGWYLMDPCTVPAPAHPASTLNGKTGHTTD